MHRRHLLKLLAASALAPSLPLSAAAPLAAPPPLENVDNLFLDDLQRRGCFYFVEQASPFTGQVLDRALSNSPAGRLDPRKAASIAATGFGLSCLCVADKRGFLPPDRILAQVRRTLRFHAEFLPHNHGFFTHFNDVETGKPFGRSEVSSIDTALLLCGVLTARAHFHHDAEIVRLATTIYERVDWPWMLDGAKTFSMGLRGGTFLTARWGHYAELLMLYLLAIGSPTHPVDPSAWDAFTRPHTKFAGIDYIGAADPLFVHQFSHAWFDFRGQHDKYGDYFANSILATRAHLAFCLSLGSPYSLDYWGISASDFEHGYTAWGGPPSYGGIDGSVVPSAAAGSLPFLPNPCLHVLRSLKFKYGDHAWGRYGFCDAFRVTPGHTWFDPDVLGIDLGIGVLMAENLRTGFVWDTFKRNPEVPLALKRAGFTPL